MHVYAITNSVNGKKYVGITDVGVDMRWWLHQQRARLGGRQAFSCAIRKHGPDAFIVETLEECPDREILCAREVHWITHLGTFIPHGYNMTLGGEGLAGLKHSDETRRKMSVTRTGRKLGPLTEEQNARKVASRHANEKPWHSESSRQKMSESRRGVKRSIETCEKISEALKLRVRVVTAVDQFDVTGVFIATYSSAQLAAEAVSGRDDRILATCRGLRKTHCGFIWHYADGEKRV